METADIGAIKVFILAEEEPGLESEDVNEVVYYAEYGDEDGGENVDEDADEDADEDEDEEGSGYLNDVDEDEEEGRAEILERAMRDH